MDGRHVLVPDQKLALGVHVVDSAVAGRDDVDPD